MRLLSILKRPRHWPVSNYPIFCRQLWVCVPDVTVLQIIIEHVPQDVVPSAFRSQQPKKGNHLKKTRPQSKLPANPRFHVARLFNEPTAPPLTAPEILALIHGRRPKTWRL